MAKGCAQAGITGPLHGDNLAPVAEQVTA